MEYSFEPYLTRNLPNIHDAPGYKRAVTPADVRHEKLDNDDLFKRVVVDNKDIINISTDRPSPFVINLSDKSFGQFRTNNLPVPRGAELMGAITRLQYIDDKRLLSYYLDRPHVPASPSEPFDRTLNRNFVPTHNHPMSSNETVFVRVSQENETKKHTPLQDIDSYPVSRDNGGVQRANTLTNDNRLFGNVASVVPVLDAREFNIARQPGIDNDKLFTRHVSFSGVNNSTVYESARQEATFSRLGYPVDPYRRSRVDSNVLGVQTRVHGLSNDAISSFLMDPSLLHSVSPSTDQYVSSKRVVNMPHRFAFDVTRRTKKANAETNGRISFLQEYSLNGTPFPSSKTAIDTTNIYGTGSWVNATNKKSHKPHAADISERSSFHVGTKPPRRPVYNGFQIGTNTTIADSVR